MLEASLQPRAEVALAVILAALAPLSDLASASSSFGRGEHEQLAGRAARAHARRRRPS